MKRRREQAQRADDEKDHPAEGELDDAVEAKAADRDGALIRMRQPRRQLGAIAASDRDRDQKESDLRQKQPSEACADETCRPRDQEPGIDDPRHEDRSNRP